MAEAIDDAISLVGSRVALVAGPGMDAAFLGRVRQVVHSKDPFGLLVSAMTDAGLQNVPSLACAVTERGGVRVLVRGAAKVLIKTTAGASKTVSAKGVSTWAEHAFTNVEELVLVAANGAGATTSLVLFLNPSSTLRTRPTKPDRPPTAEPAPVAPIPAPTPPTAPVTPPPPEPEPLVFDDELDLEHLVGETRYRGAEAAAVRDLPASTPSFDLVPAPESKGDHDGNTVSIADLRAALAEHDLTAARPTVPGVAAVPTGPTVQAVFCTAGHPNPPHAPQCRACTGPILDRAVQTVPRPVMGSLHFSDGLALELDGPLLLGRKPTYASGQAEAPDAPRLVALVDPDHSLSRLHVEVQLDGWEVLIVDRNSTNGTCVQIPGERLVRLHPDEPCLIVPGTTVDLGDIVSFRYDGPSGS